ncbi:hypothetical protein FN846DRAFT_948733 [Sphaerosporella brunnea]|uniref:Uncharacterized protein n=1 Tax=Sphaerosporella brunnea TaxID=1250544 RepID=A0A5J5EXJ5_9PEZI|nr:hypothetical protein FN846DRAFT_948733 [Sphaerosporella brunnea]
MSSPNLSNARVLLETATGGSAPTKVLCVTWELSDSKAKLDGEWLVDWEGMYAELSEDVRSARSEQGGYFVLQGGSGAGGTTADDSIDEVPSGPLSTARLLEFENGPNMGELQEDLPTFFSSRPIVQAPTQIISDPTSPAKKTEALFLLAPNSPIPPAVSIYFTPTWTPPNTPPTRLAEIKLADYVPGDGLHTAWATKRIEDLKALQEIAKELEREGSRGTGQGRFKVGVEGGGMDEEAVRREAWMVAEEQVWVVDNFLTSHKNCDATVQEEPSHSVMDPLAGLGISTGLHFAPTSSVLARHHGHDEEEDEEELFALPLSPRSPDMAMSPFSMFRGEALGTKPAPAKLGVQSIDTGVRAVFGQDVTPTQSDVTPTARAPLTPPREA